MNDIVFNIGSVNPSGISDEVYYIAKRHLRRWPTIDDSIEAMMEGRYVQYDGNFELQPGTYWSQLYNTQGKGKIDWDFQGETDCKVVINHATLSFPKITNQARAFAKFASNGDFVLAIKHDGMYYIIGSRDYRATVTPNGNSGDAPGSAKGLTISIDCPDTTPLPTYRGEIVLADGILNCNTDTFINYEDMNTNKTQDYSSQISDNAVRFEALGKEGRIHLEGSGPIKMEVSVDGVNYKEVDHDIEFENGVAIAPFQFYIGDKVRLSATTLTKVTINYNDLKTN